MGLRLARELDPTEIRVLGSLQEKQRATPEYYPLTLHALVAACNQKSNREPVTDLSEGEVLAALERLREHVLVWKVGGSRTEKWEQNLTAKLALDAPAQAVLTLLFLRGPQTPGELRSRSERLHAFTSLPEVEKVLRRLADGPDPLTVELSRHPGQKESRWAHLLGGAPAKPPREAPGAEPAAPLAASRVERLEARLVALEADLAALRRRLGE